jgi:putative transposase
MLSTKIEREDCLSSGSYQRIPDRKGYANGFKPKTVDTRMGRITVDVPQVRGDVEFYPSALEKGCRSERALKVAIAEMYVNGVPWQRCQFHLQRNAQSYVPSKSMQSQVHNDIADIFAAPDGRLFTTYSFPSLSPPAKIPPCEFSAS